MDGSFRQLHPSWSRGLLVAGALLLVVATSWMVMQVYTPPASRECGRLYHSARTAADSARVDQTTPAVTVTGSHERRSCGAIRSTARWQ